MRHNSRPNRIGSRSRRSCILGTLALLASCTLIAMRADAQTICSTYETSIFRQGGELPCYYPVTVKAHFRSGATDTRVYSVVPTPPSYYDVFNPFPPTDSLATDLDSATVTFPGGQTVTVVRDNPWPVCPEGTGSHVTGVLDNCKGWCYDIDIRPMECDDPPGPLNFCPHIHIYIYPCDDALLSTR